LGKKRAEKPPVFQLNPIIRRIKDLNEGLPDKQDTANRLNRLAGILKWWIDIGFGTKGVKAYIFEAMLERLNTFLRLYGEPYGYVVKFGIDMDKAGKPFKVFVYAGGTERPHEDLSGGERQRIDIFMIFAMFSLLNCNSIAPNIFVLDEAFTYLDEDGMDLVLDLSRETFGPDVTVFMISHITNITGVNVDSRTVVKVNNLSHLLSE